MAFSFGAHSVGQRATLHQHLREVLDRVLMVHDCRIEEGARTPEKQWAAYNATPKTSKVRGDAEYPHRIRADGTSWAADVYPIINGRRIDVRAVGFKPIESAQFAYFLGLLMAVAKDYFRGHEAMTNEKWALRLGVDWDRDGEILSDQTFHDWPHVELERIG